MRRVTAPRLAVLGLVTAAAAVAGATAALLTLPAPGPSALDDPPHSSSFPVTSRDWSDERPVQLSLQTGAPRVLGAPRAGVLTALACSVGAPLTSGDLVATVDDAPVTALATASPLWRDLAEGDSGPDVEALQRELSRLGLPVSVDGVMGKTTLRAAASFLGIRGERLTPASPVPADSFAWIPGPEVTVAGCAASVGSVVDVGDVLLEFPVELRGARLVPSPLDAAPGPRSVSVDDVVVPIGDDGTIGDPAGLALLTSTTSYAAAVSDSAEELALGARWVLSAALRVFVVAPTALWDLDGSSACLEVVTPDAPAGRPVRVDVLGSQLGQSFVLPADGDEIRSARTLPDTNTSCR